MTKILIASLALFALVMGVIFVLPRFQYEKDYVRVEIGETSVLAEVARDPSTRALGLSGREGLAEYSGMLFIFDGPGYPAIWMKDMKFPIDIVWIKNNQVADLEENVSNPRTGTPDVLLPIYRPDSVSDAVLELPAGFSAKSGIKIGSNVRILGRDETFLRSGLSASAVTLAPKVVEKPAIPGLEFSIESVRSKKREGGDFRIVEAIEKTNAYRKFSISYRSGDLKISGIMNVPLGNQPAGGFPVLILNHGLIAPDIYFSGRGSKREQDFFAKNGYIIIHPDYRGLASSSPNPAIHHDFYEGYAEDVVNLIDSLHKLDSGLFDENRIGMWGHSMGGGIATRIMVRAPEVRAFVLFAPISADAEDNFYELSEEEVNWLYQAYGPAGSEIYRRMSPIEYFEQVSAPVQLHHGTADKDVPLSFSEKMFKELERLGKRVEFYTYPGEPHEFADAWPLAAERSLQFFDRYVKNAR